MRFRRYGVCKNCSRSRFQAAPVPALSCTCGTSPANAGLHSCGLHFAGLPLLFLRVRTPNHRKPCKKNDQRRGPTLVNGTQNQGGAPSDQCSLCSSLEGFCLGWAAGFGAGAGFAALGAGLGLGLALDALSLGVLSCFGAAAAFGAGAGLAAFGAGLGLELALGALSRGSLALGAFSRAFGSVRGAASFGVLSFGALAFGAFSLGLLSSGVLSARGLLAEGAFSLRGAFSLVGAAACELGLADGLTARFSLAFTGRLAAFAPFSVAGRFSAP